MANDLEILSLCKELQLTMVKAGNYIVIGSDWNFEEAELDGKTVKWHEMQDELIHAQKKTEKVSRAFHIAWNALQRVKYDSAAVDAIGQIRSLTNDVQ